MPEPLNDPAQCDHAAYTWDGTAQWSGGLQVVRCRGCGSLLTCDDDGVPALFKQLFFAALFAPAVARFRKPPDRGGDTADEVVTEEDS
jgi:hypothetical protein